jgi:superoxide dismutase
MSTYTLPDLPYDYGALAPHISGEIMELHHSKHHQTYVTALNQTLDELAEAREEGRGEDRAEETRLSGGDDDAAQDDAPRRSY